MKPIKFDQMVVPTSNNIHFQEIEPQYFIFQQPIIRYLLNNANAEILRKLHSSCKLMLLLGKVVLSRNFKISSDITKPDLGAKKLYQNGMNCNDKVLVYGNLKVFVLNNPHALSIAISKQIYQCCAKFIFVMDQDLTVSDFIFLLSEKAKKVELSMCIVLDKTTGTCLEKIAIIEILNHFLKIEHFTISNHKLNVGSKPCVDCLSNAILWSLNREKCKWSCDPLCRYCSFVRTMNSWKKTKMLQK